MKLSDKQALFSEMLGDLLCWVRDQPELRVRRGHWLRTQSENQAAGGKARSLHIDGLACDLALDKWDQATGRWVYQTDTAAYRELGAYWEALGGCWGGDFGDGNHFSLPHGGMK